MYNLFYYDINKMTDEIYSTELAALPTARRKEILKKDKLDDRKRSLAGDILIKKYLSRIYCVPADAIEIQKGAHGKPYVLSLPAHFNVSHSGNYTAVAISDEPIGLDIEAIGDFSAILAKKLFNSDELNYVTGENSPTRKKSTMSRCFYELWTAKEAYLKYTGEGLAGGKNALSFKKDGDKLIPTRDDVKLTYDFSIPGTVAAIVTARA